MLSKQKISYLIILFSFAWLPIPKANGSMILLDKVIAIVDQEQILYSDLDNLCTQLQLEGKAIDAPMRMNLLRELVCNKIFVAKARADGLKVPEAYIQGQCDNWLAYYMQQVGSEANLVQYFNQSVDNIKKMVRRTLEENALATQVKQALVKHVVVTPAEVKAYFDAIPLHKRPYYPTSFEIRQLVIYPKIAPARIEAAKHKLLDLKKQLLADPTAFAELAKAHSDDPGSAPKGGVVGWVSIGMSDPAYEVAALALKVGEISDPIKSEFGLHLIMLLGRSKNQYNASHILKIVQPTQEEIASIEVELNQIRAKILEGTLTMEAAIQQYSEDKDPRHAGGVITYNQVGETLPGVLRPAEDLDSEVYFAIEGLQEGDISKPQFIGKKHKPGWRLLYLKQKVEAHGENLTQDYEKIHHRLLQQKQQQAIREWVQTAQSSFVISFAPEYQGIE